jgi:hypothetical protein
MGNKPAMTAITVRSHRHRQHGRVLNLRGEFPRIEESGQPPCHAVQRGILYKRRTFLFGLRGTLAVPPAGEAQQAGRVYRIGVFASPELPEEEAYLAFRPGLRELGYVAGRNALSNGARRREGLSGSPTSQ